MMYRVTYEYGSGTSTSQAATFDRAFAGLLDLGPFRRLKGAVLQSARAGLFRAFSTLTYRREGKTQMYTGDGFTVTVTEVES